MAELSGVAPTRSSTTQSIRRNFYFFATFYFFLVAVFFVRCTDAHNFICAPDLFHKWPASFFFCFSWTCSHTRNSTSARSQANNKTFPFANHCKDVRFLAGQQSSLIKYKHSPITLSVFLGHVRCFFSHPVAIFRALCHARDFAFFFSSTRWYNQHFCLRIIHVTCEVSIREMLEDCYTLRFFCQ